MAKILLVEDDHSVRDFVARALGIDRHIVVEAEDGERGLEIYCKHGAEFDLVLTDIQMPGMDGIAMTKAIAEKNRQQRILMMTGYANQRERAEALSAIVIDVMQKPFTLPQLRSSVKEALSA